jgi:hypothetical protein
MDAKEFTQMAVVFAVVVVPALGLTMRFALKPFVDAILRLKEGGVLPSADPATAAELRIMREELLEMRQTVRRLEEADSFHRELGAGSGANAVAERQSSLPEPRDQRPVL